MPPHKVFVPAPQGHINIESESIKVPEPLTQSEAIKPPMMQRIMPFIMIGMVGGMLLLMFTSGNGFSPFMLMMPMMMVMGMMQMLTGGSNDTGELNAERKNYALQLREERKIAHRQGSALHKAQALTFPGPTTLINYIGQENPDEPIMWRATEANPGGLLVNEGSVDEVSFSPYLSARIGKGTTTLQPALTFDELQVAENLEPVTTSMFRSFVRTQGFVTNMPVALNMISAPAFALTGSEDKTFGLARAMIMSMAFSHSPSELRIAVVSDDIDSQTWQWMKWLPHCQHPEAVDRLGTARLLYTSMHDFAKSCPDAVSAAQQGQPRWLVVVDKPHHELRPPVSRGFEAGRLAASFLVVRAGADYLATSNRARYDISPDGILRMPGDVKIAADYVSVDDAERFTRAMACWRPMDMSSLNAAASSAPAQFKKLTWLEVMGIEDIDAWDPRETWELSENSPNYEIPLGYARRDDTLVEGIVTLDFAESSRGGSGVHGVGQGKTGTGKSFLLGGIVLSLATLYSPHKVNFILMDFKGGSSFLGYEKLPHTVAIISNLASETELLDRAQDVIKGEIDRRQEVLKKYNAKDIYEYREKRLRDASMPPMPALFIIADEFREFITTHREYMKLFESIAAIGRSCGVHLLLVSQYIDSSLIQSVEAQLSYGISLAVNSERESRTVIGNGDAAKLSVGTGDAIVSYKGGTKNGTNSHFRAFNIESRYVPPAQETALETTSIDTQSPQRTVTTLEVFTARNQVIEHREDDVTGPDTAVAAVKKKDEVPEEVQMKSVLISHLSKFDDMKGLDLWKESLRVPLTYATLQPALADPDSWDMSVVIGETDYPYRHRRIPYVLNPSNPAYAHTNIIGRPASGKSTTVEAIISSTALSYAPSKVQFLIIDYAGAKLREVEDYPHVIGYASGSDQDLIDRFFGEVNRVVQLRKFVMAQRENATASAYLASKSVDPVEGDPYGRLFLVIDGFGRMVEDKKNSDELGFDQTIIGLMKTAMQVGVHFLVTTEGSDLGYAYNKNNIFGKMIPLKMDSPADVVTDRDIRAGVVNIPDNQPGRSVDTGKEGLYSRVLIPQAERVEPIGFDEGNPIYAADTDYGDNIRALAKHVRSQYEDVKDTWVPRVVAAPASIDYAHLWSSYAPSIEQGRRTAALPFAMETADLSIIDVADSPSPHLIVLGDPGSGRSTALRTLINDVVQQRRPHEAQFLFFDPEFEFFSEKQVLEANNMCLAYATSTSEASEMFETLAEELESRILTSETMAGKTKDDIVNRRWYDGPDFYVIIDNLGQLGTGFSGGPANPLGEILDRSNNLGCFVFAAGSASEATALLSTASNKLPAALMKSKAPVLLLSGSDTQGKVVANEKFSLRRPGQGRFVDTSRNPVARTVQVANTAPWPAPDA